MKKAVPANATGTGGLAGFANIKRKNGTLGLNRHFTENITRNAGQRGADYWPDVDGQQHVYPPPVLGPPERVAVAGPADHPARPHPSPRDGGAGYLPLGSPFGALVACDLRKNRPPERHEKVLIARILARDYSDSGGWNRLRGPERDLVGARKTTDMFRYRGGYRGSVDSPTCAVRSYCVRSAEGLSFRTPSRRFRRRSSQWPIYAAPV